MHPLKWNHASLMNIFSLECEIKNPATKLNVSRSITRLQFVTYAKFIQIRNASHRFLVEECVTLVLPLTLPYFLPYILPYLT